MAQTGVNRSAVSTLSISHFQRYWYAGGAKFFNGSGLCCLIELNEDDFTYMYFFPQEDNNMEMWATAQTPQIMMNHTANFPAMGLIEYILSSHVMMKQE